MASLEKKIEELKASPLYALSLSGKELAHSNFWKWLMDLELVNEDGKKVHPFVGVFIKYYNDNTCEFVEATREQGNRDITIYYKRNNEKKAVVIENKIKSIPNAEQLEKYEKKEYEIVIKESKKDKSTKKEKYAFEKGVLTGLIETLDLKSVGLTNWKFITYSVQVD